jgi:hypothetical protein
VKYKRCCLDRDRSPISHATRAGAPRVSPGPAQEAENRRTASPLAAELTIILDTPGGRSVRRVPTARALPGRGEPGPEAEAATADAASLWGLPDFVCHAGAQPTASGVDEIGDRLLVVGDTGVVVQVKCRDALTDDGDKEARWIVKHVRKAVRQARGTVRTLRTKSVTAVNARGRQVEVGGDGRRWLGAVVIDHPSPPEDLELKLEGSTEDLVVLLRRDWEFLFDQLKSTHAVVEYLRRVSGEIIELGTEPLRYYDLAEADARAEPAPVDATLLALGGIHASAPLLPLAPVASEDRDAHRLVRMILEDVATGGVTGVSDADRLRALAELDRLPVSHRADVGRFLLGTLERVSEEEDRFEIRRLVGRSAELHLAFGAWSRLDQHAFSGWVQLRHHELQTVTGKWKEQITVAVLLTPRHDGRRPWDTTMIAIVGDLGLTDDELSALRHAFNSALV